MLDEFTTAIAERCRWAREHNQGHPSATWSTSEQLAVALVLRDRAHLNTMGYTTEQAAEHVCSEAHLSAYELTGWLNDLRSVLDTGRHD